MTEIRLPLAIAFSMSLLAPMAQAQTAPAGDAPAAETQTPETPGTDAPANANGNFSMGEEVNEGTELGTPYVAEEHGDWQLTCVRSGLEADPCQIYQLLQDDQGNSVAEISLVDLPAGGQAVTGATIVTPLETLLTAQITMRVDSGQAKRYPFTFCASMGCVARVGFTEAELASFRRGNRATLVIVPAMLPDEQVPITMSLSGFTAAYQAMVTANVAASAAAEAAGVTEEPAQQGN